MKQPAPVVAQFLGDFIGDGRWTPEKEALYDQYRRMSGKDQLAVLAEAQRIRVLRRKNHETA